MDPRESHRPGIRARIARAFTATEDVVYVGLGLLASGATPPEANCFTKALRNRIRALQALR